MLRLWENDWDIRWSSFMCTFKDAPGMITVGLLVVLAAGVVVVVVVVVDVDVVANDSEDDDDDDAVGFNVACGVNLPLKLRYFEIPDCRMDSLFRCCRGSSDEAPVRTLPVLTPTLMRCFPPLRPALLLLPSGIVMRSSTSS
jgi:hypothetical protein